MADQAFINSMLQAHNKYRQNHGVSSLKINQDLNRMAQGWANQLAMTNTMGHSTNRRYKGSPVGENIAYKWASYNVDYDGDDATKAWYDEISQYNFSTGSGPGTGHFTQVVWRDTQEIGMGKAHSPDGQSVFVVANYYPAGNYIGRFQQNVFPPGSKVQTVEDCSKPGPRTQSVPSPFSPTQFSRPRGSTSPPPNHVIVYQMEEDDPQPFNHPLLNFSGRASGLESPTSQTRRAITLSDQAHPSTGIMPMGNSNPLFQMMQHHGASMMQHPGASMMQHPGASASMMRGYNRSVCTETTTGADGRTSTRTREMNNEFGGAMFGQGRPAWF